jgi:hypothetical protein
MLNTIIISLIAGILVGYSYGLLFLSSGKGVPSLITHVILTLVRFAFLIGIAIYLLLLPSIQPVILVLSFLTTFWLVIIRYKAQFDEKHRATPHN